MRNALMPANLKELLGSKKGDEISAGGTLQLKDLSTLLGEKMPEIPFNRIGKFRLVNALKNRFGDGWMNIPGLQHIMHEFDEETDVESIAKMNREG